MQEAGIDLHFATSLWALLKFLKPYTAPLLSILAVLDVLLGAQGAHWTVSLILLLVLSRCLTLLPFMSGSRFQSTSRRSLDQQHLMSNCFSKCEAVRHYANKDRCRSEVIQTWTRHCGEILRRCSSEPGLKGPGLCCIREMDAHFLVRSAS